MERRVTTVIDSDLCSGCGLCITVCPAETISMINRKAVVTGSESIGCGHCEAVCPTDAITVTDLSDDAVTLKTVQVQDRWLPHGHGDTGELVRLMRSRRSCRNFRSRPVPAEVLEDLVKIGTTAPSGSNCQPWAFTILPTRAKVAGLADAIADYFRGLNRMAANPFLRNGLRWLGKEDLHRYYRDYHQQIQEKLTEYDHTGRDFLFWEAPALIIVAADPTASCPAEDALLATGNILLAAHTMGLGTCLIGFAVAAMARDRALRRRAGVPPGERVHAVIAVGWPNETYQHLTRRRDAAIRFCREEGPSHG